MSLPYRASTSLSKRALLRWLVVPLWILLMAALVVSRPTLTDRLEQGGWIPAGAESVAVDRLLATEFDRRSTSHLVLFEPVPPATTVESTPLRREVARISSDLARTPGVSQVLTPLNAPTAAMRESLRSTDGGAWLAVVQVEDDLPATIKHLPALETALHSELLDARVTGVPALTAELGSLIKSDLLRAEVFAFAIALIVLSRFAGGTRHALAIVLTTSTALAGLLLSLTALSHIVHVNIFALSVAAMLTIALSLDFSLLTTLCAGELGAGDHTRRTLRVASGAVIVGMAGLTLLPFEAARSIGGASMLGVCFVALSQRLVLPAWLRVLGADLNTDTPSPGVPSVWPERIGRRPVLALLLGVSLVLPLMMPVMGLRVVGPNLGMLPKESASADTLTTVRTRFPDIGVTPISVVAKPTQGSMLDAGNLFALRQTEERLASLPGVRSVRTVWDLVPRGISSPVLTASLALDPTLVEQAAPLVTERGAIIEIDPEPGAGPVLVGIIRSEAATFTGGDLRLQVGGLDAGGVDLLTSITDAVIPAATLVIIATIAVLMMALRSIVLPIKAVLLNAIPLLSGLGVVTLLFQLDTPLHPSTGGTVVLVPLVLTWLMFGISMDYEVFMLARVRQFRDLGYTDREATLSGISAAGTVVLRGALMMGIVFVAFSLSEIAVVRAIGIGMLVAIVVDATVVRMLLLPASMVLLGRWNWWWPSSARAETMDRLPALPESASIKEQP